MRMEWRICYTYMTPSLLCVANLARISSSEHLYPVFWVVVQIQQVQCSPFHPEKELRVCAWCCILSIIFFVLGFELLILIFSYKSGALPALFMPPRYPFCTLNKRLLAVASQSVAIRIWSIMLQVLAKALERLSQRKKNRIFFNIKTDF